MTQLDVGGARDVAGNPWLTLAPDPVPQPAPPPRRSPAPAGTQPGCVPEPDLADRLPLVPVAAVPLVWTAAHGGAGAGSLALLLPGSRDVGQAWPVGPDGAPTPVLLVARTSAGGLRAAQRAAVQWAAGAAGDVDLLGLVLVADRPGRLPRDLRRLRDLVAGGVPRRFDLPWVEEWHRGCPPDPATAPGAHRRLLAELAPLLSGRHRRTGPPPAAPPTPSPAPDPATHPASNPVTPGTEPAPPGKAS